MKLINGWVDAAIEDDRFLNKSWPRGDYRASFIVIHKTAGGSSAKGIADYFADPVVEASSHIIVDPDGSFIQGIPTSLGAWANAPLGEKHAVFLPAEPNPNLYTVAIEIVDPATDNSSPLTDAQKATVFSLVACLCSALNIPARAGDATGGVIGHCDIDGINRANCPGNFPWQELWEHLGENSMLDIKDVSAFFTQDKSGNWTCKTTKNIIIGGILGFYRANNGLAMLGLPVTGELYDRQDAAYQIFERGVLVYDPQRKYDNPPVKGNVYPGHIDGGFYQDKIWHRNHPATPGTPVIHEVIPQAVRDDIVSLGALTAKIKNDAGI